MGDKEKNWQGGTTFGDTNRYNEMIRESEDYYDVLDSEIEFREELVKRERLMKEEAKKQQIESKYALTKDQINKNIEKPTRISTGDPIRKKK